MHEDVFVILHMTVSLRCYSSSVYPVVTQFCIMLK